MPDSSDTQEAVSLEAEAALEQLPFSPELLGAVAGLLLATTFEGVWLIDKWGRTTFVNQRMASLLGYSIGEMVGAQIFDFMDSAVAKSAAQNLSRRKAGVSEQHEIMCRRKDGAPIWLLVTANPVFDRCGGYAGSLALIADLSAQKDREEALLLANAKLERELAEVSDAHEVLMTLVSQDALTGLCNRRSLDERLGQELARCERHGRKLSLLLLDLDGLQGINDRFGYAIGDEALCHVARLLQAPSNGVPLLRTSDLAGRLGGDEIVVVAVEADIMGGHTLARRFLRALKAEPLFSANTEVSISVSIGVASYPEHALSVDELLAVARAAMNRAKVAGGGRAHVAASF